MGQEFGSRALIAFFRFFSIRFVLGGICQARSAGKKFCRPPPLQSVVLVSASVWPVQFDHFLVFCSSYSRFPPCPVICKSVGTCPRALDGVSVTFALQFHTRKHCKTAIQSECIASQGLFSIFAFKITHRVILFTRFCKPGSPVSTLSGGGGTCLKCFNGTTPLITSINIVINMQFYTNCTCTWSLAETWSKVCGDEIFLCHSSKM